MFVQDRNHKQPVSVLQSTHFTGLIIISASSSSSYHSSSSCYYYYYFHIDGSDVIQQWCKFNMGALASGSCFCDEWKTQGQPSGQTAVSQNSLKVIKEYFCLIDVVLPGHLFSHSFYLFSNLCVSCYPQKPKQIRVYQSQISNAGFCPSHALPGGWQHDSQGFKQGNEKYLHIVIRRNIKQTVLLLVVSVFSNFTQVYELGTSRLVWGCFLWEHKQIFFTL